MNQLTDNHIKKLSSNLEVDLSKKVPNFRVVNNNTPYSKGWQYKQEVIIGYNKQSGIQVFKNVTGIFDPYYVDNIIDILSTLISLEICNKPVPFFSAAIQEELKEFISELTQRYSIEKRRGEEK